MTSKQIERRFNVLKTAAAIFLALGFALLVITFVSEDPVKAITAFIFGPFIFGKLTNFEKQIHFLEVYDRAVLISLKSNK